MVKPATQQRGWLVIQICLLITPLIIAIHLLVVPAPMEVKQTLVIVCVVGQCVLPGIIVANIHPVLLALLNTFPLAATFHRV